MSFHTLNPQTTLSYSKLSKLANLMRSVRIEQLFAQDANRVEKMSVQTDFLFLDYSKNLAPAELATEFIAFAQELGLESFMESCLRGDNCNITEGRAVMHVALRDVHEFFLRAQTQTIYQNIQLTLQKMHSLVERVHKGEYLGYSHRKISRIVNIGIGGSELGPKLVISALDNLDSLPVDFISNIDSSNLNEAWNKIKPEETLFLVSSKTFSTEETLTNAETIRRRICKLTGDTHSWQQQFIAITANVKAAENWGILSENIFEFSEAVGGRYSLSGAIGLSIALSLGWENFANLLEGLHEGDLHFFRSPWEQNIPFILAIIGYWYGEFFHHQVRGLFVYSYRLRYFVDYLQQLEMESNGKSIDRLGQKINYLTNPLLIGGVGTNVQHSFFQQIHQGTSLLSADFLAIAFEKNQEQEHQNILHANFIAQTRALMLGDNHADPFRTFPGNIPTNSLILSELNAYNLGYLLAIYEHKVLVQGILWNICSYDQFGVELGKTMSREIMQNSKVNLDPSSKACLNYIFSKQRS